MRQLICKGSFSYLMVPRIVQSCLGITFDFMKSDEKNKRRECRLYYKPDIFWDAEPQTSKSVSYETNMGIQYMVMPKMQCLRPKKQPSKIKPIYDIHVYACVRNILDLSYKIPTLSAYMGPI